MRFKDRIRVRMRICRDGTYWLAPIWSCRWAVMGSTICSTLNLGIRRPTRYNVSRPTVWHRITTIPWNTLVEFVIKRCLATLTSSSVMANSIHGGLSIHIYFLKWWKSSELFIRFASHNLYGRLCSSFGLESTTPWGSWISQRGQKVGNPILAEIDAKVNHRMKLNCNRYVIIIHIFYS